jgi:hypothetical protein
MDVGESGLDGFVLLQMLGDLVWTALRFYKCKNIWFGSSVWILGICYGLLCAAKDVERSGLEYFELVWMFGNLVWTALGTITRSSYLMFGDITGLPLIKTVKVTNISVQA